MLIIRKEELFLIWGMCRMQSMLMTVQLSWNQIFLMHISTRVTLS